MLTMSMECPHAHTARGASRRGRCQSTQQELWVSSRTLLASAIQATHEHQHSMYSMLLALTSQAGQQQLSPTRPLPLSSAVKAAGATAQRKDMSWPHPRWHGYHVETKHGTNMLPVHAMLPCCLQCWRFGGLTRETFPRDYSPGAPPG